MICIKDLLNNAEKEQYNKICAQINILENETKEITMITEDEFNRMNNVQKQKVLAKLSLIMVIIKDTTSSIYSSNLSITTKNELLQSLANKTDFINKEKTRK